MTLWHVELLVEAALAVWLSLHHDGRPRFESLIWADFMTQLVQCAGSSLGWHGWSAQIWYVGAIIAIPLMALALEEAADYRPLLHRSILYWWIAVTFACAWIRVYPYTGSVLLLFNTVVFALWLALAVSSKRQGGHLHGRYKN